MGSVPAAFQANVTVFCVHWWAFSNCWDDKVNKGAAEVWNRTRNPTGCSQPQLNPWDLSQECPFLHTDAQNFLTRPVYQCFFNTFSVIMHLLLQNTFEVGLLWIYLNQIISLQTENIYCFNLSNFSKNCFGSCVQHAIKITPFNYIYLLNESHR